LAATLPAEPALSNAKDSGRPPERRHNAPWGDAVFSALAHGAAWLTLAILAGIIGSLIVGAMPAMRQFGISFLWHSEWDPVQDHYGGLAMIYGTLATSAIALVIAVPVSFGIALFLTEMCPPVLKRPLGTAVELLPQPLHHPVEVTPGDVVLRLEVAEEGASTDPDRAGDVLDRRRLESALGEEAEGDSFDLLAGGGGGSS